MLLIVVGDVSYPDPHELHSDPEGLLGEETWTFQTEGRTVATTVGNLTLVQMDALPAVMTADEPGDWERINLSSGAVYESARPLSQPAWEARAVPDLFGEEQVVFDSPDGLFITQRGSVVAITVATPKKPGVRSARSG